MNGIVIIGPPGSGKSSIARTVAQRLSIQYVSSGDIARKLAIFDKSTSDSLSRGGMANEALMRSTIHSTLYNINYHGDEFILDGFPRNIEQLEWLLNRFPRLLFYIIDADTSVCIDRLMSRGREDDEISIILNRIQYYLESTKPMLDAIFHIVDPDNIIKVCDGDLNTMKTFTICDINWRRSRGC